VGGRVKRNGSLRIHATHFFSSMVGQEYSSRSHQPTRADKCLGSNFGGSHVVAKGYSLFYSVGGITTTWFRVYVIILTAIASMLPTRLARLTLYSGSNCSLCDVYTPALSVFHRVLIISQVAKAELTKVRQKVSTTWCPFFGCGGSLTQTVYLDPCP
jgi:hypothetical protein